MALDNQRCTQERDVDEVIASIKAEVAQEIREDGLSKSRVRAGNRPFVIQSAHGTSRVAPPSVYTSSDLRRSQSYSTQMDARESYQAVAPRSASQDARLRQVPTTSSTRAGGTDTFLNAVARQNGQALGTATPAYQVDAAPVMPVAQEIDYKAMRPSWVLRGLMFWIITLIGFAGAAAIYWRYWMPVPPMSPFEVDRPQLLVALFGAYAGCGILAGFLLGIIMRFSAKKKGDPQPGSWIVSGIGRGALAVCVGAVAIVAVCILADMHAHGRLPF